MACLQNTRKNSIVWPRDIADDPASLAFEAIETIIWKLPIAPVVRIVSKYFETTGAIRTIRTIIWKPGLSSLLTMKNFLCCLTFSSGKTPAFRTKIIQLSTWMRWPSPSICQCLDLEKETFWCDSYFPNKVYFLYIKDTWFALPKYVQISLSLTSSLARPPQLLSFFEVKTIHQSNFQSTSLVRRKKERYLDLRGYVTPNP